MDKSNRFLFKIKKVTKIKKTDLIGDIHFKIYPNFDHYGMRDFEFNKTFIKSKEFQISHDKNIEINLNSRFNLDLFFYENLHNEIALIEKDHIFF